MIRICTGSAFHSRGPATPKAGFVNTGLGVNGTLKSGRLDDPSARHDRRSLCMLSWSWIGGVPFIHLKTERWPWILYTSWLEASEADGCKGWFDKRIWIWWQSWQQYSRSFAFAQWGKKESHKTVRYNSPVLMLWMHETTVQCITVI